MNLLGSKNRRIQQNHADNNQYANHRPDDLDFLLMFFVEKHILNVSHHDKFSTKESVDKYNAIKTCPDIFWNFNTDFCLEYSGFLGQDGRNRQE